MNTKLESVGFDSAGATGNVCAGKWRRGGNTGRVDYADKRGYRREHLAMRELRRVANLGQILERLSAAQIKK